MIIWCIVIAIFSMKDKKVRSSIKDFMKSVAKIIMTIPGIVMIIYIVIFGLLLHRVGYLKSTIIKDYIWWVLFGLIPVLTRIIQDCKTITVKQIIKDVIKFSIIPLFIINTYTMNLAIELLIIPLAFICSACLALCDYKAVSPYVKKVFNAGILIISTMIIYYGFKGFFINIDDIKNIVFWKSISIDIICILGSLPLIFYFRGYILYEQVGLYIGLRSKLNKWVIYLVTFKNCLLSTRKLVHILDNINEFYRIESWRDLDCRIEGILNKKQKAS